MGLYANSRGKPLQGSKRESDMLLSVLYKDHSGSPPLRRRWRETSRRKEVAGVVGKVKNDRSLSQSDGSGDREKRWTPWTFRR